MKININKDRLVKRFCDLVAIDSESYHERAMADYLTLELQRLGFIVEEDDAGEKIGGNAGNLYACLPENEDAEKPAPGVIFTAHMDTVRPGIGKKAILCDDGTIRSDGTTVLGADDAGAIAVILEAVEETLENGALPPVEILFTVAEEVYGYGAAAFDCTKIKAGRMYGLDLSAAPGGYSACEPSLIAFTADIQGTAAHAGFEPEKGVSAINAAAAAILSVPQGWVEEGVCCNIGMIEGGKATNIVPEHVALKGEIRSRSHQRALALIGEIEEKMRRACEEAGAALSFSGDVRLVAYEVPVNDPAVLAYKNALAKLDPPLSLRAVPTFGGSDMNEFRRKGIDGITLALPMYRAHSVEEYTVIEELAQCTELVRRLITLSGAEKS